MKTVCPKGRVGSNPTLCATKKASVLRMPFLFKYGFVLFVFSLDFCIAFAAINRSVAVRNERNLALSAAGSAYCVMIFS